MVMLPLSSKERIAVVGLCGGESMMSKPFVEALVGGFEVAVRGGEESAIHIGVQKWAEVGWEL